MYSGHFRSRCQDTTAVCNVVWVTLSTTAFMTLSTSWSIASHWLSLPTPLSSTYPPRLPKSLSPPTRTQPGHPPERHHQIPPPDSTRVEGGPFRLKHKTQGPSHIHIPKGKLLLTCFWKDGLPLHSKIGIISHLQTKWGARVFHPVALLKLMFL